MTSEDKDFKMDEGNTDPAPKQGKVKPAKAAKRWTWKKPKGKPKRPLSAYNLFFRDVRKQLMEGPESEKLAQDRADRKKNGLGFKRLATIVCEKWKTIPEDDKAKYMVQAAQAKQVYMREVALWEETQKVVNTETKEGDDDRKPAAKTAEQTLLSKIQHDVPGDGCPLCIAEAKSRQETKTECKTIDEIAQEPRLDRYSMLAAGFLLELSGSRLNQQKAAPKEEPEPMQTQEI